MGNKYSLGVYGTFDFRKNKLSIIHVQNLCFSESCFSEHKLCWSWVTFIKYNLIWCLKKSIIFLPRGAIYDRYHITKSLKKNYKDLTVRVSGKGSLPWQKVITPKLAKIEELQNNQIFLLQRNCWREGSMLSSPVDVILNHHFIHYGLLTKNWHERKLRQFITLL